MIVWWSIVGVLFLVFAFNAIYKFYVKYHPSPKKVHHFFEIGKEREIFYCPGDKEDDEYDL